MKARLCHAVEILDGKGLVMYIVTLPALPGSNHKRMTGKIRTLKASPALCMNLAQGSISHKVFSSQQVRSEVLL